MQGENADKGLIVFNVCSPRGSMVECHLDEVMPAHTGIRCLILRSEQDDYSPLRQCYESQLTSRSRIPTPIVLSLFAEPDFQASDAFGQHTMLFLTEDPSTDLLSRCTIPEKSTYSQASREGLGVS